MNWKEYFDRTDGKGYMATAGKDGQVDIALYSRPHVLEDGTLAFGMADRLTHANLQDNRYATYAYNEQGYRGVRLYLEKVKEESAGPLLEEFRKRAEVVSVSGAGESLKFVTYFKVLKSLPLVGT
jgi:hypothetical protein